VLRHSKRSTTCDHTKRLDGDERDLTKRESMMKRLFVSALALGLLGGGGGVTQAQSLDDLNIQIHGYATQGFLYTNQNNMFTTSSSNGSPAWDEAVVNVTAQPTQKLRVGVQARYMLLGNIGNKITLDWAAADYKFNERIGVRFGKVKTPSGLLNETQDIDPSYMWALLPQGIYALTSRNSFLSHYGGIAYGTFRLDEKFGKLDYRVFGGQQLVGADDPAISLGMQGSPVQLPNGWSGTFLGGTLNWKTPVKGLMIGSSDWKYQYWKSLATSGATNGSQFSNPCNYYWNYARYEMNKVMVAAEYTRQPYNGGTTFPGSATNTFWVDVRAWYGMASYKLADKLTIGAYHSQSFDHQQPLQPARYSKDWTVSGRYDFNQFLYTKAEQHFIDGTELGYDSTMNPDGLKPTCRLTVLKIGVTF